MPDLLRGRTVLVVEDEYYLADDLRRGLEAAGAVVLGPAASLADGLRLIGDGRSPDLAVLDVNLRDVTVYELAEALMARGIPFVFATGYDAARIPERFEAVPKLLKPFEMGALTAALEALAARG
ncbi:response regulator [Amaricoccus solimangrovi]|uniref:Response regulator n=1 Tax=Amaricoccus solimangrovi TaxID=2589815 RepID=A0A501WXF5_9RHOB|nr:response regulator [Amaricoccus solimangrovi]TPE51641.1 response regulator [Amaricoccus solimangrovi]